MDKRVDLEALRAIRAREIALEADLRLRTGGGFYQTFGPGLLHQANADIRTLLKIVDGLVTGPTVSDALPE